MVKKRSPSVTYGCLVAGVVGALGVGALVLAAAVAAGGWYAYSRHWAASTRAASTGESRQDVGASVATLRAAAGPVERARALASLEREAENGNAKAMVIVASCYRAGVGVPRDDRLKAFRWYERAANAGETTAMIEMSRYYATGVWVEADPPKSRRWLERAAAAGSAEAKWLLEEGQK